MTTPDTLPAWLSDALDYPLVGPVALIVLGLTIVLAGGWAWDRFTARELDRHRLAAKVARPEVTEYEAAADHWHRPPVQAWADEPKEAGK